jgi:hypothetical protein
VRAEFFGERAETRSGAVRRQQRFSVSLFDEDTARRLGNLKAYTVDGEALRTGSANFSATGEREHLDLRSSEMAAPRESACKRACDDLGDRRHARVTVLPARKQILRCGVFRAGSNALCHQSYNHENKNCPHRCHLGRKLNQPLHRPRFFRSLTPGPSSFSSMKITSDLHSAQMIEPNNKIIEAKAVRLRAHSDKAAWSV